MSVNVNAEIFFHGVLSNGQEMWSADKSFTTDYHKKFYTPGYPRKLFVFEIAKNKNNQLSSFYTFRIDNVSANLGGGSLRSGSYFGFTIQIDGNMCSEFKSMYAIMQSCFERNVVGLILNRNGEGYNYVPRIFEEVEDKLKTIYNLLLGKLGLLSFKPLSSLTNGNVEISEKDLFSYDEADILRSGKSILISPQYKSKDEIIITNEINRIKDEAQKKLQQKENECNTRLAEISAPLNKRIKELEAEQTSLKNEAQKAIREKDEAVKALDTELQNFNKSITYLERGGLDKLIRFRDRDSKKPPVYPPKNLLTGGNTQKPIGQGNETGKNGEPKNPNKLKINHKTIILLFAVVVVIGIVVYFLARGCSSDPQPIIADSIQKGQQVDTNCVSTNNPEAEDGTSQEEQYTVEVVGLRDSDVLKFDEEYFLVLKGYNSDDYQFEILFDGTNQDPIRPNRDNNNKFKITSGRCSPRSAVTIKCVNSKGDDLADKKHFKID